MRFDIATLFVDMCEMVLGESILGRAQKKEVLECYCHNIRDFAQDKHNRVDDTPYGGGKGMLLKAAPIYRCYQHVVETSQSKPHVIYMSPQGKVLTQQRAVDLSHKKHIMVICGHYEGIDERVIEKIVDEEVSIGDYVLTGGELPAMVMVDTVARLCDGVLSDNVCFEEESHFDGLLEYPHYTRPEIWEDIKVPEVLLSGHHANIETWRREQRIMRTAKKRPDLFDKAQLTPEDKLNLRKFQK